MKISALSTLALLCACTNDPTIDPPDGGAADLAADDAAPPPADGATADLGQAPCAGRPAAMPGTDSRTILSGGQSRTYLLHVPRGYDPTRPTPLLFLFHGFGGTAQSILSGTRMVAQADARGFLVVAPQGVANSWNAGKCCGPAQSQRIDDVGLVRDLLRTLRQELCVDERRVFASGLSNGGFMSNRLGCELSQEITGIAPVAGGVAVERCEPARPVTLIHFHARDDFVVPYAGGGLSGAQGAVQTWEGWAQRNGCTGSPMEIYKMGRATCQAYQGCRQGSAAALCTTEDGGHTWPGSGGSASRDLDASARLVDFLLQHPRPRE